VYVFGCSIYIPDIMMHNKVSLTPESHSTSSIEWYSWNTMCFSACFIAVNSTEKHLISSNIGIASFKKLELMKLELKWIKFTKNYLPFNFLL
jgi:hypothetical protein